MLLMLCIAMIVSCASSAYLKIDQQAEQSGFSRATVQGSAFRHVVYSSLKEPGLGKEPGLAKGSGNDVVHVYIDGDGVNWQWNRLIKSNPTPKWSLMLDLMSRDKRNTLYVGRPCYIGLELDEGCDADYWTYERYAKKVVDSMAQVINAEAAQYQQVVLIGHSGGGALALLLAEQVPAVTAIVTIAGIIDTDAWTTHHGHTRLVGSLNPALRPPLPVRIRQLHLVGALDATIPPTLVRDWVAKQPSAKLWEVSDFNHSCCWGDSWPQVLQWIDAGLPVSEL